MSAIDILLAAAGGEEMFTRSTFTRIVTGSGTLNPPTGAKAMRVAAIGAGGGGYRITGNNLSAGGGGGGCAASKIVKATPIVYSIGVGGANTGADGGDTTAQFLSYNLIGGGGLGGLNAAPLGGSGSGGDYNYSGGRAFASQTQPSQSGAIATCSSGGGAAGPAGNGGNGRPYTSAEDTSTDGSFNPNNGWGVGGGAGGAKGGNNTSGYSYVVTGGGGAGSYAGSATNNPASTTDTNRIPGTVWGMWSGVTDTPGSIPAGGEMGGGGGANSFGTSSGAASAGGSGGLVVEWFYTD